MLSINTNISSLIVQNSLKNSTHKLNNAIEQMTSGYKINHAKDNAASYSIVTDMSTKIGAYEIAEENIAMAMDLVNTATDGYDLMTDKLTRYLALVEQGSNGTYGETSKEAIISEMQALGKEIMRIDSNTSYNGKKLLFDWHGSCNEKTFTFQIGIDTSASSKISVQTSSNSIASYISELEIIRTTDNISSFRGFPEYALKEISEKQSELGAIQNRLESALEEVSTKHENLVSSRSTLRDTDVGKVSSEYIKQQILQQASSTLLATANQSPSIALQLI